MNIANTNDSTDSTPRFTKLLRLAVSHLGRYGAPPPLRLLSPVRRAVLPQVLASHSVDSATDLAAVADAALAAMRTQVDERARTAGIVTSVIARSDMRWRDCDQQEFLDDPDLDPVLRTGIMTSLDEFNDVMDNYERFFDELLPLMRHNGTTRVLDLAAGHGGFCLAAARIARRRGLDFSFTASDLKREYLDIGELQARQQGLDVEFHVQDALDLTNLEPDAFDIIICTQSLHHFPAGLISVMFDAATRAATSGVVFIDGCRSMATGAAAAAFGTFGVRNRAWVHDAWISTRKFFVPEELELLARLARGDGELESRWMAPGHCLLRWRPDQRG